MNYYPFHVGDYTSHTAHLEPIEDLAYRRALDAYYLREGPLPVDPKDVARLIRMRGNQAEVEAVLSEFFEPTTDGWRHSRCDQEIETMREKQQKQRDRANKRWHKPSEANADAMPAQCERNATAMPRHTESDATALPAHSHGNAGAMPPTPTPTPTPSNKRESAPAVRGSRLDPDFALPNDWIEFCETTRPDLNPFETGKRFADYWHGVPGAKGRKADWLATWRNWVRNEKPGQAAGAPRESFAERDERLAREKWEKAIGRRIEPNTRQPATPDPFDPFTIDAEPATFPPALEFDR